MNKEERLIYQRELRRKNGNAHTKKYEKTKKGFLVRLYRNMKSRITGVQSAKSHLYEGKYLINKETFYDWAMSNNGFNTLFAEWEKSGYERRLTPSVDRIDSSRGYYMDNIEFVPFHVNCSRGAKAKKGLKYKKI